MKKCLNLQAEMKNIGTRIFAFVLVLWYSLSVIGFGVHTCSESNRSFLTSFITGVSCEDIHPAEICSDSCCAKSAQKTTCKCCHEHHVSHENEPISSTAEKFAAKACCSNEYQQIDVTGSGQGNAMEINVLAAHAVCCYASSFIDNSFLHSKLIQTRCLSDQRLFLGELRPLLSVWRI
jgi:hypothetical protein